MSKRIISLLLCVIIAAVLVVPVVASASTQDELNLRNVTIGGNYVVGARYTKVSLESVKIGGNITFESGVSQSVTLSVSDDSSVGGVVFTRRGILENNGRIEQLMVLARLEIMTQGSIDIAVVGNSANLISSVDTDAESAMSGNVVIIQDGTATNAKGFISAFGDVYCVLEDGTLAAGITEVDGNKYFFGEDGIMKTGFVVTDGGKYYFGEDGIACSGTVEINGKKLFFGEDGLLRTGVVNIDGKEFYYDEDGNVRSGIVTVDGKLYFYYENGGKAVDRWVDGTYRADKDGTLINSKTGLKELDDIVDRVLKSITNDNMTDREKMRAIYPWLTKNIGWRGVVSNLPPSAAEDFVSFVYTADEVNEMALYAYQNRRGGCEHLSALATVMLRRLGYETREIYGLRKGYNYAGAPWGEHAWAEITIDGERYHFDPQYAGTHMKDNFYYYFLLPEADSRAHHMWSV